MVFENQNLKGIDLSSLNLEHLTFKNCDLALTNILENPTFKPKHIGTNYFEYQILKKIEALLKENPSLSFDINWLPISDKNVLMFLDYMIQKNYFPIANSILNSYPNLKFYGDQGGKHFCDNHIEFDNNIRYAYECLDKLRKYFIKNKLGNESLRSNFLNAFKELGFYQEKRKIDNSDLISYEEKDKARILVKSLAALINTLSSDELLNIPNLPFDYDLNFIEPDDELKKLITQSNYAIVATENNFLARTITSYQNKMRHWDDITEFVVNLISHKNFTANLFIKHEGSEYNPFDSLVYSAVLEKSNSSFKLLELLLNNEYSTFSLQELNMIRSQFFKAIEKYANTYNYRFYTLYNLFFESRLFSLKDCNEWILKRIKADKFLNYHYFISALFSKEFSNNFVEFNNSHPKVIKDCFEYCINETVFSNGSDSCLLGVLIHPYSNSKSLSLICGSSNIYRQHLLKIICHSDELRKKFLADNDLSNFVINTLLVGNLEDINLPKEWKITTNNENTVDFPENITSEVGNQLLIRRFKIIYRALYEGQSSCSWFKHWNELVDKENLTVSKINEYIKSNDNSRTEKAWLLANDSSANKKELFVKIHDYSYAKSSCFFGLFKETTLSKNYENYDERLNLAEKGSRTETIDSLLKLI